MHHSYIKHPRVVSTVWTVPALCAAYNWPTNLVGGGVIAIVELGGGWVQTDVTKFFSHYGQPNPTIIDVSVDGTANNNKNLSDPASGEVALDIQVAGAAYFAATSKPAIIKMYWASNTLNAISQAVTKAVADGCDAISISWGSDEANWGSTAANQMNNAAGLARAKGIAVFAAAGDNDSSDGGSTAANVDLPASCPHVTGCGGTSKLLTSPEVVWNNNPGNADGEGTGGGYSTLFTPLRGWQIGAPNGPGRMVPDVAANADPNTGYRITLGGKDQVFGGTSAVAPLYAGLFAAFGRKRGGNANITMWSHHTAFADITSGDNGQYRAAVGPDPCTGLGAPVGVQLAKLFVK